MADIVLGVEVFLMVCVLIIGSASLERELTDISIELHKLNSYQRQKLEMMKGRDKNERI